jgi:hypothetical protein
MLKFSVCSLMLSLPFLFVMAYLLPNMRVSAAYFLYPVATTFPKLDCHTGSPSFEISFCKVCRSLLSPQTQSGEPFPGVSVKE